MSVRVSEMERVSARISFLALLSAVFVVLSIARLAGIQIRHHEEYLRRADRQQTVRVNVEASRGEIYDCNGCLLAGNVTDVTYSVYWPVVPDDGLAEIDSLVKRLGDYTDLSVPVHRGSGNVVIADRVPWEYASEIMGSVSAFIDCRFATRRVYPLMEDMAPVVGTYNANVAQGLEYSLNDILEGRDGVSYFLASAWRGYSAVDPEADNVPPAQGKDIKLTIDARYQTIAQSELDEAVEMSGAEWGAVVIIDPSNGDVLTMASYPVFNEDGSLAVNHCVQSAQEPGSVFKAVTVAAALDAGSVCLTDSFDCSQSYIELYGHKINDSHMMGGFLGLSEVVSYSSNVGTIELAGEMPDSLFFSYCRKFGFGRKTGINFPSEQRGILPSVYRWSGLSKANLAIGQEVSATPLQIAMAYGAIANGGIICRPRLLEATRENGFLRPLAESGARRIISEETAAEVRGILRSVVTEGTGQNAAIQGVTVAGKTGTAERLVQHGYLSAFAGMVPAENPRLVAVVVFDQPDYEFRWGSTLAAPVFRNVVSQILSVSPEIALGRPTPEVLPLASNTGSVTGSGEEEGVL